MKKWFSELSSISKLMLYGILFLITFFSFEVYHMNKFETVLKTYDSYVYSYNKTLGDIVDSREVTDEQKDEIDRVIHLLDGDGVLKTFSRSRDVVLFEEVLSGRMVNASDAKYVTLAGVADSELAYKYTDSMRFDGMSGIYRGVLLGLLLCFVVLEILEAIYAVRGDIRDDKISKSGAVDVGNELKVIRELLEKSKDGDSSKEEFDIAVKKFIDKIDALRVDNDTDNNSGDGSKSNNVIFRK